MKVPLVHYYSGEAKTVGYNIYPRTTCGLWPLYSNPDMENYLTEDPAEITCPECKRILNDSIG